MSRSRAVGLSVSIVLGGTGMGGRALGQARSLPIGGRAATMGGTGVAEGHDIAAPLLNPAGIAAVDSQVFGLSSSLYSYNSGNVSGFFAPNGFAPAFGQVTIDSQTYGSSNIEAVPSGVAVFQHVGPAAVETAGHLVLGLAALSPIDSNQQADARLHATLQSTNGFIDRQTGLNERALDIYVGPVAGLTVTPRLRVGVSLLGLYRNRYLLATTTMTQSQQGGNDFASYRGSWLDEGTSVGGIAVGGLQFQALDDVWLGASFQSPSVQVAGNEHQTRAETLFLNAPPVTTATNAISQNTADLRYTSIEPPRLSLGVAYERPGAMTLAGDVTYVIPYPGIDSASGISQTSETISGSATRSIVASYNRTVDGLSRLNFSVGAEVYVTPNIPLRAGFSEAFDSRGLPPPGAETAFTTRRNLSTVTTGLGLVLGPFDTTIGAAWQHATGTIDVEDLFGTAPSVGGNYPGYARLALTENTFMLLLSGTVSQKEAVKQLGQWFSGVSDLVSAAASAVRCPKTLDATAIATFDYEGAFQGHEDDAKKIRPFLSALADLVALSTRVEAQVTTECSGLGQALGLPGAFEGPADACGAAARGVAQVRARFAPADWGLELVAPSCSLSLDGVAACLGSCGESGATLCKSASATTHEGVVPVRCSVHDFHLTGATSCAANCEKAALDAVQCTAPRVHFAVDSASPELVAIESHLPGLMSAAASLPGDAAEVLARAKELVAGVQSTARLLGDGPEAMTTAAACVVVPAVGAFSVVDGLTRALDASASVVAGAAPSK